MATEIKNTRAKSATPAPSKTGTASDVNLEDKIFRFLAIVLFGFIMYFIFIGFLILAGIQYLLYFAEGAPHKELKSFIDKFRTYISEIFAFLGFASNRLPFPFSPFPKK